MDFTPPPNPFEDSCRCGGCQIVMERDCYIIIESPEPTDVGKTICPECSAIMTAPPINARVVLNRNMMGALKLFQFIQYSDDATRHQIFDHATITMKGSR